MAKHMAENGVRDRSTTSLPSFVYLPLKFFSRVPYCCCGTPPMFGTFCFASFFAYPCGGPHPIHPFPPPFSTWDRLAYKKAAPSLIRIKPSLSSNQLKRKAILLHLQTLFFESYFPTFFQKKVLFELSPLPTTN